MLIHDLAFGARLLRRSPGYTAIIIGGFAVALAACILVVLFARHELGYDAWLRDADRLYRVHMRLEMAGREPIHTGFALGPLRDELLRDADVEAAGWLMPMRKWPVFVDDRATFETITLVDRGLLDVLDLPLARGTRELADPRAYLITESVARRHFGDTDPLGRTLRLASRGGGNGGGEIRIVGVLRDPPVRSHLEYGLVGLVDLDDPAQADRARSWDNVYAFTYVRLRPGADPDAIARRLDAILDGKHREIAPSRTARSEFSTHLIAVRDLHLRGATDDNEEGEPFMRAFGDPGTLYAILGVGALLLAIAIANFVNLTTARAGRRAREIAIRKAAGAQPRDIVVQYLAESVLIALLALVAALMIVELALPWFERLAARDLEPPHDPGLLAALAAGAVVLGLASGLYPAFVLARYQPAAVMNRNQGSVAAGAGRLRAVLVFAQFAAAIALAFGTTVVVRQARHAADVALGYAKDDRIIVEAVGSAVVAPKRAAWLEQVARLPGVADVTLTSDVPGRPSGRNTMVGVPGRPESRGLVHAVFVDHDTFDLLEIAPLAGRVFERDHATDDATHADARGAGSPPIPIVLNEAAVRRFGLGAPADAVGRELELGVAIDRHAPATVIGVVPDVNLGSRRRATEPAVYTRDARGFWSAIVQARPGAAAEVHRAIAAQWAAMFPEQPLWADFAEDTVGALYRRERRLASILTAAALLALAVACLGLYGLAAFLAESRRKEIAIRKVLGASVLDVIGLLAWQLARPIALACAVAAPLAYLAAERWLAGFAYRIELGLGGLAATLAAALAIAAATVAAQSVRSARAAPVDALRGA